MTIMFLEPTQRRRRRRRQCHSSSHSHFSILSLYSCLLFLPPCLLSLSSTTTPFHRRLPSRPPAPLLSSVDGTSITVSFQLDPNDDVVTASSISHYQVQFETSKGGEEFIGIWKDLGYNATPSNTTRRPSSATLSNVHPNERHRFRIRTVTQSENKTTIYSPWSSPSNSFQITSSSSSSSPSHLLPPSNLHVLSTTITSIRLAWNAPPQPTSSQVVESYDIEYRRHSFSNARKWRSLPNSSPSDIISNIKTPYLTEIQHVTTLVDNDSLITSGEFYLSLTIPSKNNDAISLSSNSSITPSQTISHAISHNATADDFINALSVIHPLANRIKVTRYAPFSLASDLSLRGAYTWRVEFLFEQKLPLLVLVRESLNGIATSPRVDVRRMRGYTPAVYKSEVEWEVNFLEGGIMYGFRVRGRRGDGDDKVVLGPWSDALEGVATSVIPPPFLASSSQKTTNGYSTFFNTTNGNNRTAAQIHDGDYISGVGMGGLERQPGGHGMVVVVVSTDLSRPSRTVFRYTGGVQRYVVPDGEREMFVRVKLWGAGGGGGATDIENSTLTVSHGGGGGYTEVLLTVKPHEQLTILVGGGGQPPYSNTKSTGGYGGYNGGGDGGHGRDGGGGGGGGMTSILRNQTLILVIAGGGGGGGYTDYCCAHGGAGGGTMGSSGAAPATPIDLSRDLLPGRRDEFTPEDCTSDDCVDERDVQGLPAYHLHLDRGFAPNASYSIRSTSGGGGSTAEGTAGISGNYAIDTTYYSTQALPGGLYRGGHGANGKEGGGGGGGGYYGGGGGGSGVDGSGGGGGGGFVSLEGLYRKVERLRRPERPAGPMVVELSHDAMTVSWDEVKTINERYGFDVRYYELELSTGRNNDRNGGCSDDFQLVHHGKRSQNTVTLTKLTPNTVHCLRLLAISNNGISERSETIVITTSALPHHEWRKITTRRYVPPSSSSSSSSGNDERSVNERLCPTEISPSARRGASLSHIGGRYVYLFGGISEHCHCVISTEDDTIPYDGMTAQYFLVDGYKCKITMTYSNELWRFDLVTKFWMLLQTSSQNDDNSHPMGRERHSAIVTSKGTILIIGGLTTLRHDGNNTEDIVVLGDVWEMKNPERITSHIIQGFINDGDDEESSKPVMLNNGDMFYHQTFANITRRVDDDELCIVKVEVNVLIQHYCLENLKEISLFGPGPRAMIDGDLQRSRGHKVKLFMNPLYNNPITNDYNKCTNSTINITFSDDHHDPTTTSILNHMPPPTSGIFHPAETLSSFRHSPVNGEWTLSLHNIAIRENGNNNNTLDDTQQPLLLDWKLFVDVTYCNQTNIKWTRKESNPSCERGVLYQNDTPRVSYSHCSSSSSSSSENHDDDDSNVFLPRYGHSSIRIGDVVYLTGGYSGRRLSDLWMYEIHSGMWTKLNNTEGEQRSSGRPAAAHHMWSAGQGLVLTPWGMFGFGGLMNDGRLERGIWKYNIMTEVWSSIVTSDDDEMTTSNRRQKQRWPYPRYHATICYIDGRKNYSRFFSLDALFKNNPFVLLFGGDRGLPQQRYIKDFWLFSLKRVISEEIGGGDEDLMGRRRSNFCDWRLDVVEGNSTTASRLWEMSCSGGKKRVVLGDDEEGQDGKESNLSLCRWEDIIMMAWCREEYQ